LNTLISKLGITMGDRQGQQNQPAGQNIHQGIPLSLLLNANGNQQLAGNINANNGQSTGTAGRSAMGDIFTLATLLSNQLQHQQHPQQHPQQYHHQHQHHQQQQQQAVQNMALNNGSLQLQQTLAQLLQSQTHQQISPHAAAALLGGQGLAAQQIGYNNAIQARLQTLLQPPAVQQHQQGSAPVAEPFNQAPPQDANSATRLHDSFKTATIEGRSMSNTAHKHPPGTNMTPCRARGMPLEHNFLVRYDIANHLSMKRTFNANPFYFFAPFDFRLLIFCFRIPSNMEMIWFVLSPPVATRGSSSVIVAPVPRLWQSETLPRDTITAKMRTVARNMEQAWSQMQLPAGILVLLATANPTRVENSLKRG
jgi:hypothetical protein